MLFKAALALAAVSQAVVTAAQPTGSDISALSHTYNYNADGVGTEGVGSSDSPNPIYDASKYTTNVRSTDNGFLQQVTGPDVQPMLLMHLYGNATERGRAHGELLADELIDFMNNKMIQYFSEEIDQVDLSSLPKWLQDMILNFGHTKAPAVFEAATQWVLEQQRDYLENSKAHVLEETAAVAAGACAKASTPCDVANFTKTVESLNMLPELIRMQCSMMGAWGKSTSSGDLIQLRSLDFGGGPFGNYSVLQVHHPSDGPAFASLSFPGFVGVVTGWSEHIALSEKVNMVSQGKPPKGTYKGQSDVFAIRDILQYATSKESAIEIAEAANRTWPIWLGVGDFESQEFRAMRYSMEQVEKFDDVTLPNVTSFAFQEEVAYIDKHPQPSANTDMTQAIEQLYGKMTAKNVVETIPHATGSGDVHIAVYDFGEKQTYISLGTVNEDGSTYIRKACEAPFMQFDMQSLWDAKPPKAD